LHEARDQEAEASLSAHVSKGESSFGTANVPFPALAACLAVSSGIGETNSGFQLENKASLCSRAILKGKAEARPAQRLCCDHLNSKWVILRVFNNTFYIQPSLKLAESDDARRDDDDVIMTLYLIRCSSQLLSDTLDFLASPHRVLQLCYSRLTKVGPIEKQNRNH
jgi:hypothetical protein